MRQSRKSTQSTYWTLGCLDYSKGAAVGPLGSFQHPTPLDRPIVQSSNRRARGLGLFLGSSSWSTSLVSTSHPPGSYNRPNVQPSNRLIVKSSNRPIVRSTRPRLRTLLREQQLESQLRFNIPLPQIVQSSNPPIVQSSNRRARGLGLFLGSSSCTHSSVPTSSPLQNMRQSRKIHTIHMLLKL